MWFGEVAAASSSEYVGPVECLEAAAVGAEHPGGERVVGRLELRHLLPQLCRLVLGLLLARLRLCRGAPRRLLALVERR